MKINLLKAQIAPGLILTSIAVAPRFDTTPIGDFVFVLPMIGEKHLHFVDLGGFGNCIVAYTDRIKAEQYRIKNGLLEYCDMAAYRRSAVEEVCRRHGAGLVIDDRIVLAEGQGKGA